jgi:hypothetical protein
MLLKPLKSSEDKAYRGLAYHNEWTQTHSAWTTQRGELGATGLYTVRSPQPCYELDETRARFPAVTLRRTNHTPLGLPTPPRGRNRQITSGCPEGGGATEGSQACLLEGVMVCGAGCGWHEVVSRAPSAMVTFVYWRTSGALIR